MSEETKLEVVKKESAKLIKEALASLIKASLEEFSDLKDHKDLQPEIEELKKILAEIEAA
jgi:predicted transcriptional regulator